MMDIKVRSIGSIYNYKEFIITNDCCTVMSGILDKSECNTLAVELLDAAYELLSDDMNIDVFEMITSAMSKIERDM